MVNQTVDWLIRFREKPPDSIPLDGAIDATEVCVSKALRCMCFSRASEAPL